MFEIYFGLGGILKNRSSIFRGFTVLNSISLMNISKYFHFAKELALHQNDNYVGSNENALIYNGCITQGSSYRKGSDKGTSLLTKAVTSIAPLQTLVTMWSVQMKKVNKQCLLDTPAQ